ncbi:MULTISPECIES: YbhB/YbcL family Raf kinase inhibitor-like protein [unclassified Clostridioides]|uniref:YbhB/YbcL family Raf kinase inhibitor-like protein n=1 Tax=unclassified Clostridioides TaxID=2635829 RepID=UPI001D0C1F17|nr:YbhB/YbcL family Raf kinase inhibitor-like protein [Clostridioides sp. ES-S-0001-02]MCC0641592.1 YbhB/YbcL family Raf kinase inhibitor-like protein [Clostridioides sp. ES-S-0049-03]MCC0651166.1 YbhB/YbcL family Raf kinase inhibitor-like protein [Clostridioides sp. ES-S-0001-03]MCC0656061.1 YbhB/YbcL family Raf kinase inhibitor-like protein [Clostridioides sp. ES-S-0123-01]MCC0673675.1 YbhB/YbcL family Raf kinase inhibitor-like protein [Clostridioides sp. ES-S-0145-01]MCC0677334.1 YbhB/YbcL 
MKVTSTGIVNGVIEDKYGKRGNQFNKGGMPTYSLPLKFEDAPEHTVSFAVFLEDKDSVPVCGFAWIHWLAANITKDELKENESITATDFIQGTTSWHSKLGDIGRLEASVYGGMAPPDRPHVYEIHVFALDTTLNLEKGFYMNEFFEAMDGHILDRFTLKGSYSN